MRSIFFDERSIEIISFLIVAGCAIDFVCPMSETEKVISRYQLCDGEIDCEEDGSDESDCFQCQSSLKMYHKYVMNDSYSDCPDKSDEDEPFTCDNGLKIPQHYRKNDQDDCGDGSDLNWPFAR